MCHAYFQSSVGCNENFARKYYCFPKGLAGAYPTVIAAFVLFFGLSCGYPEPSLFVCCEPMRNCLPPACLYFFDTADCVTVTDPTVG